MILSIVVVLLVFERAVESDVTITSTVEAEVKIFTSLLFFRSERRVFLFGGGVYVHGS
jgi:hypothetical protein